MSPSSPVESDPRPCPRGHGWHVMAGERRRHAALRRVAEDHRGVRPRRCREQRRRAVHDPKGRPRARCHPTGRLEDPRRWSDPRRPGRQGGSRPRRQSRERQRRERAPPARTRAQPCPRGRRSGPTGRRPVQAGARERSRPPARRSRRRQRPAPRECRCRSGKGARVVDTSLGRRTGDPGARHASRGEAPTMRAGARRQACEGRGARQPRRSASRSGAPGAAAGAPRSALQPPPGPPARRRPPERPTEVVDGRPYLILVSCSRGRV